MRVGIISFAHMHAHSYAKAILNHPLAELVGVADDNASRGLEAAKAYSTSFFSSLDELFDQNLDAVIITSENAQHHQHVLAACERRIPILCEKPLATSVKEAQEMVDTCNRQAVPLQIAFPVRYNTSISRVKQLIDDGKLGKILAIRGTNRGTNPGGWFVEKEQSGGGAVTDHTVHLVDLIRWFTSSEVTEVYAEAGTFFSENPTEDAGIVTIELENGTFATIDCSWSRNQTFPTWGDVTLEIIAENGTLSVDAFGQMLNVYADNSGVTWNYWGDDMDEALVYDFLDTCQSLDFAQSRVKSTGIDGLRAVEVVEAAYRSIQAKQPVRL